MSDLTETEGLARAKINLALDVLHRREDGYHELSMITQTVGLRDTLSLRPSEGRKHRLILTGPSGAALPADDRNLALAAVRHFLRRAGREDLFFEVTLDKRIPVCAGLGGGSADAAAVLRALRDLLEPELPDETLLEWALELGSDVPCCFKGGTLLAQGRGERLTALAPLPPCHIVLCKPPVSVSTGEAFALLDRTKFRCRPDIPRLREALARGSLREAARYFYNVFEEPITHRHRILADIRGELLHHQALGVVMSGSGPTMLAVYADAENAKAAYDALRLDFAETYLCEPES